MNWFDAAALVLLLLFAWRGYRRGLLSWLAGVGGSLLALALAVVLAPVIAPLLAPQFGWGRTLSERVVFVGLLFGLRLITSWALRELVASLRPLFKAMPPLALADHLLGTLPSLIAGAVVVGLVLLAAFFLPVDRRLHDAATQSFVGRTAAAETRQLVQRLPQSGLLSAPAQLTPSLQNLVTAHLTPPSLPQSHPPTR
jgi:uncharacterized membrane protein required for colicin V production